MELILWLVSDHLLLFSLCLGKVLYMGPLDLGKFQCLAVALRLLDESGRVARDWDCAESQ